MRKTWLLAFTAIVCFTSTPVLGQSKVLRVGAVGSPPFVIQEGTKLTGIALDIWDEIARMQGLRFQMAISNNVPETIDAVAQNDWILLLVRSALLPSASIKWPLHNPFFRQILV